MDGDILSPNKIYLGDILSLNRLRFIELTLLESLSNLFPLQFLNLIGWHWGFMLNDFWRHINHIKVLNPLNLSVVWKTLDVSKLLHQPNYFLHKYHWKLNLRLKPKCLKCTEDINTKVIIYVQKLGCISVQLEFCLAGVGVGVGTWTIMFFYRNCLFILC